MLFIIFISCQKDNATVDPVLISFGPTTVKHGETIKFIGKGLDQVTEIVMPVDISIPSSAFTTHTSSLIELVVPEISTVGYVTLKTNKGSLTTKTTFGAAYAITVRSFTPATTRPGTNITINGSYLNYVKKITFSQGQSVTQFVSQSLHQLVLQVPMAAQTGAFSLTDMATTPQVVSQDTLNHDLILTVTLPVATSFSPAAGVTQTSNLTINGTDLDLVSQIEFTGTANPIRTFVSQSATQIVVAVPNTAITGSLKLTAPSGVKVTTPSVTILEPAVTAMTAGKAGVSNVTITGTNLSLVASITFPGGAVVASTSFVSQASDGTSIVVAIPASATPGTLQLVTTHSFTVSVPNFKITLPVATSYSGTTPGASTTITGTDLDLVASIIFPDGTAVASSSFTAQTSTSITVTVPATVTSPGALNFKIANGYQVAQPTFGACSTSFAGSSLLYSFDANLQGWGAGTFQAPAGLAAAFTSAEGHSCPGAGKLTIPFATYGQNADIEINPGPAMDFTGKSKLHMWAKIQIPAGTAAAINGVQAYVNTGGYSKYKGNFVSFSGALPGGGSFSDGNWHEIVFDIAGNLSSITVSVINQFGLQILLQGSAPGGGPATPPQVILLIDDVWVE
ncbi:hypothetical protein WSM22_25690 [Cytophagales bacterium WSM2-2]|nr:hypothetical protein WSM22_25690 [Cytophagales bacterium WSM2-2]